MMLVLSNIAKSHSNVTILMYIVNRCKVNISSEFVLPSLSHNRDIVVILSTLKGCILSLKKLR